MGVKAKELARKLAVETVQALKEELLRAKSSVLTNKEVETIITKVISDAYDKASLEGKKLLFRDLSLLLHPDRLEINSKELHHFLNSRQLKDEPQKISTRVYEPHKIELEDNQSFWTDLKTPNKIFETLLNRVVKNPLWNNINRYVPPFNWLGYGIASGVLISLAIIGSLALVFNEFVNSVISDINAIVNMIANVVTNNFYNKLTNDYKADYVAEYKGYYVKKLKEKLSEEDKQKVENYSDDEFLTFIVGTQAILNEREKILANHNKAILDSIPVANFNRSVIFLRSVYHAFTQRLVEGNIWINLLIKNPFMLVAAPFILAAVVTGDLAKVAIDAVSTAELALGLAIYYATLIVISMPLKIYDSLYDLFIGKDYRMFFNSPKINKTNEFEQDRNPMHKLAITNGSANTVKVDKTNDSEPGHHPNPFTKSTDARGDDTRPDNGETIQPVF